MERTQSFHRSLVWKLVLPLPILLVLGILVAWFVIPKQVAQNVVQATTDSALQTANQLKTLRGYYTKNVVKKVVADGNMTPSFNHREDPQAIPLPATFIHDLSALVADSNTTFNLYSAFPFPLRQDRDLDGFQEEAWAYLEENPEAVFVRSEEAGGRHLLRVAIADRMVEGCVGCHNSHAQTPKDDWQLGDVRGVLEVSSDIMPQLCGRAELCPECCLWPHCRWPAVGSGHPFLCALCRSSVAQHHREDRAAGRRRPRLRGRVP